MAVCMRDTVMNDEYTDEEQRYAVCNSIWNENNKDMEAIYKYGLPCSEIKDVNIQKRTVQAYYYNSQTVDSDNDLILPGAYAKSITERGPKSTQPRIKHLYNHWDAAGVLLELGEDDQGGWFLSKLGRHTVGRDVLTMYDDGLITEHSHGFEIIKTDNDRIDDKDVRVIKEAILWEVTSLDKWGANQNTPVIKSKDDYNYWIKKLDKLNKAFTSGNYSDEAFELLEIQLKQIQEIFRKFELKPEQPSTTEVAGGQPTSKNKNNLSVLTFNKNYYA